MSDGAHQVVDVLRRRGASFLREVIAATKLDEADARRALNELVAAGLIASDGFAGLRATSARRGARRPRADRRRDPRLAA